MPAKPESGGVGQTLNGAEYNKVLPFEGYSEQLEQANSLCCSA